jgi:PAS domain S-box-containing protein
MTEVSTFFRHLVEQFPGVAYVLAIADDGRPLEPIYVSAQTDEIMGIPQDEWQDGSTRLERVHPDDRERVRECWIEMSATGMPETCEYRWIRPDGRQVWLSDTGALVCYASGERYLQGLVRDVSAAKQAEEEREQMQQELRLSQKLEAVGQLAAGIAHEINTPVQFVGDSITFVREAFDDLIELTDVQHGLLQGQAALLPQAEQAREAADVDYLKERVPAAFGRAIDGIDRVATIVRAIRDFAHPSSVDQAQADLNEAIRSTLIVATTEYKYIADLEIDLQDLPLVRCNVGDLNQVFLNLIVNAAHAIADKAGDSGERGLIRIATRPDGDHVEISVADSGCGIPPEIAERIFDPFFTTKEVGRGTGQGLAIARTLVVERHGGTLSCEESAGGGTVFHVRIPCDGILAAPLR